ncbi:hypothetical protein LINPERPRIM_LOCUS30582 [Linum perenne]
MIDREFLGFVLPPPLMATSLFLRCQGAQFSFSSYHKMPEVSDLKEHSSVLDLRDHSDNFRLMEHSSYSAHTQILFKNSSVCEMEVLHTFSVITLLQIREVMEHIHYVHTFSVINLLQIREVMEHIHYVQSHFFLWVVTLALGLLYKEHCILYE